MYREPVVLGALVRLKRAITAVVVTIVILAVLFVTARTLSWVTPAGLLNFVGGAGAQAPQVVPALREWHGASGSFALGNGSRIVLDPASAAQLQPTAQVFQKDLGSVTKRTLPIVTSDSTLLGDFYLAILTTDKSVGDEGYTLAIGDATLIRAPAPAGVLYGTRSVLQMLAQDGSHRHLQHGTARDWPKYKERAFMLDAGRKFFPLSALEDYVRLMAWYKLNDFHLHLNDNSFGGSYAAFRLNSDKFPGLAAKDGSYSKQDIRELQDVARAYAVTITPEIDTPSHALALAQYRPDIAAGQALDITNPKTITFMNSIWDEFLPWFDTTQVSIGGDEYGGDATVYRNYINTYDDYLKSKGKTVRMWNSGNATGAGPKVHNDITIELWDTGSSSPQDLSKSGFNIINANGSLLYIVPGPCSSGCYPDYLNSHMLFDSWEPYVFDPGNAGANLASNDPHVLGGMFSVWNDNLSNSDGAIHDRVKAALPVMGEKMWDGAISGYGYDQFQSAVKAVGDRP
ncbi:MAG TPA: family 20 glycosylhydrolase [Ktedonobacterales bacterium]|nr:family 20 glycosylhydrolase [Ktedonobacterales bacterium]